MTTRGRYLVPAVLVMLTLGVAMPSVWPLTSLGTASHDAIDAYLFLWEFWWTKEAVSSLQNPYWTPLLLHPSGASLAFASYPLPYCVASLPFQLVWPGLPGQVVAFNVLALASFAASALAAYALSLSLTRDRRAALVAGLVFACLPYRLMNVARLHVLSTECLALFVWAWIAFADRPSRARSAGLAVSFAALYYSSAEYALYAAGFVLLWLIAHWRRGRALVSRPLLAPTALAVLMAAVLTAPLVAVQTRAVVRGDVTPGRALDEAALWSPALASFVTPSRQHPIYGSLFAVAGEYGDPGIRGMRSETALSITALALAAIGLTRMRRDKTAFWAVAFGTFFVLSLGPYLRLTGTGTTGIPLPYLALYHLIPPLQAARDPTRLVPVTMLAMSVLAAFGTCACLTRMKTPRAAAIFIAAIALLVAFESLTRWPAKTPAAELIPPAYARLIRSGTRGAVIDLTGDHQAMLAQTSHGRPITGGHYADPRAAGAGRMLYVETDLRNARAILALDSDQRTKYVEADRALASKYDIRFVVTPPSTPWVGEYAGLLGFELVSSGGLEIYERAGPAAQPQ